MQILNHFTITFCIQTGRKWTHESKGPTSIRIQKKDLVLHRHNWRGRWQHFRRLSIWKIHQLLFHKQTQQHYMLFFLITTHNHRRRHLQIQSIKWNDYRPMSVDLIDSWMDLNEFFSSSFRCIIAKKLVHDLVRRHRLKYSWLKNVMVVFKLYWPLHLPKILSQENICTFLIRHHLHYRRVLHQRQINHNNKIIIIIIIIIIVIIDDKNHALEPIDRASVLEMLVFK